MQNCPYKKGPYKGRIETEKPGQVCAKMSKHTSVAFTSWRRDGAVFSLKKGMVCSNYFLSNKMGPSSIGK